MTPTKNTRIAAVAGVAVALVAAGGAYAASKIRHGSPTAAAVSGSTFVAAGRTGAAPAYGFGFRGGPRAGGDDLAAAADYLGTTTQDLLTQLQSGKTLAQIADATSGKSSSGLIDALVAAEQKEHPDASASDIRTHVTALVNGTGFPFHGPPPGTAPPGREQQQGTHI